MATDRTTREAAGRTGRRPGNPDTRSAILEAAAEAFAANGFAGTSVRKIAAAAGVDAALIHHYFGSKQQLFLATVQVPIDISAVGTAIAAGGVDGIGERIVRIMLGAWDGPAQPNMLNMLRSVLTDPDRAKSMREFVLTQIVGRILRTIGVPADELALRGSLVVSQVLGLVSTRHLLDVQPLATLPADVVAKLVGPTLQRYIEGPLPGLPLPS